MDGGCGSVHAHEKAINNGAVALFHLQESTRTNAENELIALHQFRSAPNHRTQYQDQYPSFSPFPRNPFQKKKIGRR
jgi:hypothetical protein